MTLTLTSLPRLHRSRGLRLLLAGVAAAATAGQAQIPITPPAPGGAPAAAATPAPPRAASRATPAPPRDRERPARPQNRYPDPEAAAQALAAAVRGSGEQVDRAQLSLVLGRGAGRVFNTRDAAQDARARSEFLAAFSEKVGIEMAGDKAALRLGNHAWPVPFPLVKEQGQWRFDTRAGLQQFLDQQIGANGSSAIQVCLAYVDAQREYVLKDRNKEGLLQYAQRVVSRAGRQDGLYWPTAAGEPPSPMGARFAIASRGALRGSDDAAQPFEGYFFRILTAQGPHATGGAYDYLVRGKLIGGFAMVAWPARYGVSGVMTFIVNHDGQVYGKNLGRQTTAEAQRIQAFDPDPSWKKESP